MTIVDSTVWIDLVNREVNPHTTWLRQNEGSVGLTDLILCEVLQGTNNDLEFQRTLDLLLRMPVFASTGASIAVAAARNYRLLRARGITIRKTIDCLIATFCIQNGYTLLHHDRDFDVFERELGLRAIKP